MKHRWSKVFFGTIFLVSFLCNLSFAASPQQRMVVPADYDSIKRYITQLAEAQMKEDKITGLSLALVDEQGIIFTLGLGYADQENKTPVTSVTLFRIGSISKLFTATAIMQLAEVGKIDIDKPLQTYIPEFSMKSRFSDAGPITIRSIMTHRSGIPFNWLCMYNPNGPDFTTVVADLKNDDAQ